MFKHLSTGLLSSSSCSSPSHFDTPSEVWDAYALLARADAAQPIDAHQLSRHQRTPRKPVTVRRVVSHCSLCVFPTKIIKMIIVTAASTVFPPFSACLRNRVRVYWHHPTWSSRHANVSVSLRLSRGSITPPSSLPLPPRPENARHSAAAATRITTLPNRSSSPPASSANASPASLILKTRSTTGRIACPS